MSTTISDNCLEVMEERKSGGGNIVVHTEAEDRNDSFRKFLKVSALPFGSVEMPGNRSEQINLIEWTGPLTFTVEPRYSELFQMVGAFNQTFVPCCIPQPTLSPHAHLTVLEVMFCQQADEFFGWILQFHQRENTFKCVSFGCRAKGF